MILPLSLLLALAPADAATSTRSAYDAVPQEICQPAAPVAKPKRRSLGLGGLLSAARRAGVGDMLGAGVLGDSRAAQVAGVVAGTAIKDRNPTTAVAGLAGSSRLAQAASAAVGTATELARRAPSSC